MVRFRFLNFRFTILLALIVFTTTALGESEYASVLQNADWGWKNRNGVDYGKASFADLYGNPQVVSIARYSSSALATTLFDKEKSKQGTNSLAAEVGAVAAINGSYFNMTDNTSCTALWIYGNEIATTTADEFARCNGVVAFKDGEFTLLPYGSSTTATQLSTWGKKYDAFVVSGPILRLNGVSQNPYIGGEGFYGPHPRTMLGKCADGTVYMVVAEGRLEGASGFSLPNLLSLAEDLNMTDAINLDGGGSSTLWVTGAGVINRLSGGAVRNVPNIVIATPREDFPTEDDMTVDGIKYMFTSYNTVSVTYPNDTQPSASNPCPYSGEVTIPATVKIKGSTYNVTAIGDYAFHYANITALNLPEGITKLGYKAIYQTQLTEIKVPNSVTLMDYEALGYNKVLEKITFGENIAANTWGDKLCIYGGKKYEVYMNCDAVPTLRTYTFDFTGANVHVRPTMYTAFKEDTAWGTYDIIGDLWKEYTYDDLQMVINEYSPKVPVGDAVGTDPGCYSASTAKAMSDAMAKAQALDENATLEQLNKSINEIKIAYDSLYVYPLNEGYYYIESTCFPGYVLQGDADNAGKDGLKAVPLEELETPPYFKLTRKNGNWIMQCVDNGMYVGTVLGSNTNGRPISLTKEAQHEQVITWVNGGQFKIQGSATYPYGFTGSKVRVYNYSPGGSLEPRLMWHLHPATSGMFTMDYNLENGRVRGFVHDFEYTQSDASKVSTYNVSPPVRRDWPLPVEVFWNRDTTAIAQQIMWSESPDFEDAVTKDVDPESASYEIYNLIPGRTYYCQVISTPDTTNSQLSTVNYQSSSFRPQSRNLQRSRIKSAMRKNVSPLLVEGQGGSPNVQCYFSFNTTGQMRHLKAEGTANVRDLGGWPTECGRPIKYGKIFRGAEWNGGHNLEPEAIEELRQAGIKAELDLRSDSEAKNITRSVLGTGITYKRTPLGQTASHMEGLTNSKATYKNALQFVLTCVKNDKPVYFHCAIGRDRTGTLAFLIEGLLGMSKSDIYKDYELTNFSYFNTPCSKGQLDDMFKMIEALEGETLEQKFRKYVTTNLTISSKSIDDFRNKMLGTQEEVDLLNEVNPNTPNLPTDNQVYDLSGRKVLNAQCSMVNGQSNSLPTREGRGGSLPKGLYLINGKKIAIK